MISISLKSKRKPSKWSGWLQNQNHHSPSPTTATTNLYPTTPTGNATTELFNEACRRDRLIKDRVKNLRYKEGDHVKPYSQKEIDAMGDDIVVIKICDSYAKFGKTEEWPKNEDKLMLIHAFSTKNKQNFMCTPMYLVPKE